VKFYQIALLSFSSDGKCQTISDSAAASCCVGSLVLCTMYLLSIWW